MPGVPSGAFGGPQLRHLVALAAQCRSGGQPALQDESVRQRLAAFTVRARAIRHLSYRPLQNPPPRKLPFREIPRGGGWHPGT